MVQQMRETFQKNNLETELAERFEAGEGATTGHAGFYSRKQQVNLAVSH
tara:strand:- start:54 stop:200 length:147 start_codon:yes stop_codon:yes gene_type:complete